MKAQEVMTYNVDTCRPDTDLETVATMLRTSHCKAIPIVEDGGRLIGIVTDRDMVMTAARYHQPLGQLKVHDAGNGHPVISCRANADLHAVLGQMSAHRVRLMPVVDELGQVKGILSMDDLARWAQRGRRGEGRPELSYEDVMVSYKNIVAPAMAPSTRAPAPAEFAHHEQSRTPGVADSAANLLLATGEVMKAGSNLAVGIVAGAFGLASSIFRR